MSKYHFMAFRPEFKNPCKQYNFSNWDDYVRWRERWPYKNEIIRIITFVNDRQIDENFDYPDGYYLPF